MWESADVALGCALSATLPEDKYDNQPLHCPDDASVLVADLRIDNRQDLCGALGIAGGAGLAMADSALLQVAWNRWGEGALDRLVGDFAFAVWEPRRQRLVCARDHFGRRAMHYIEQGPLFAFSSVPKGIHALPGVRREVDRTMMLTRLALLPQARDRSFFQDVKRLPPGHMLVADRNGVDVRPYWKPDTERRVVFSKDCDYVEAFRDIFDQAVRCRLRSCGPVGTALSGGFDSSSVTVTAARLLAPEGQLVTAFTGVPAAGFIEDAARPGEFGNEGPHAASVAALYPNVKHILVPPVHAFPFDLLAPQRMLKDTPGGPPCMAPSANAMESAQQEYKIRTLLGGAAGNLTISYEGLDLLPGLIRRGRWIRWASEAAALGRTGGLRGSDILRQTFRPFIPKALRRRADRIRRLPMHSMVHPGIVASGEILEILQSARRDVGLPEGPDGRKIRAAAFRRVDHSAAGAVDMNGVSYRDPTIDKRLVEFCLAIPEEQFLHHGQTKSLLRRAMAGQLPAMILDERRTGSVGADWYLRVAPYRDRFAEAVERVASSETARELLDVPRMRGLIDSWPRDGWSSQGVAYDYRLALCRGLAAGEFICWVEEGGY
jgi:asparagine synthase (glutamine-hydrolysing)